MSKVLRKFPLLRLGVLIVLASILSVAGFQQVSALRYDELGWGDSPLVPKPPQVDNRYIPITIEGLTAVKPLKISKYIDLTQGLKLTDEQIVVFIVQRSDGTFEQYLFPANFQGDVKTSMNLLDKDKIIYSNPLKRTPSTPVPLGPIVPTPNQESLSPEVQIPYPAPLDSENAQEQSQSPNPYP